jgi:hypothetical protein
MSRHDVSYGLSAQHPGNTGAVPNTSARSGCYMMLSYALVSTARLLTAVVLWPISWVFESAVSYVQSFVVDDTPGCSPSDLVAYQLCRS